MPLPGSKIADEAEALALRLKWECISEYNGFWRRDGTPRVLPWPNPNGTRLPCYQTLGPQIPNMNVAVRAGTVTEDTWKVPENLKYVWTVMPEDACGPQHGLTPFNSSALCSALRRACQRSNTHSIFVVGDSIMIQFLESLFDQLRTSGEMVLSVGPLLGCLQWTKQNPPRSARDHYCHSHMVCGPSAAEGGVLVHFAWATSLQRCAVGGADPDGLWTKKTGGRGKLPQQSPDGRDSWGDVREYRWMDDAVHVRPSIVVLNRGAHFAPNEDFIPQLTFCLSHIRRNLPESLLVFRSTSPGHVHCERHRNKTAPVLDFALRQPPRLHFGGNPLTGYHWEHFEEQNQISKSLVEAAGGVHLDIFHMSLPRADWHLIKPATLNPDCLHFCAPGPIDSWVQLFTSMLQDLV